MHPQSILLQFYLLRRSTSIYISSGIVGGIISECVPLFLWFPSSPLFLFPFLYFPLLSSLPCSCFFSYLPSSLLLFSHLLSAIDGAIKGETVEWESEWDQVRAGAAEVPQWWPFPEPYPQHHGGVCMGGWEHVYEYVWEGGGDCVCMHECVLHSAVFYYS